jgi:putative phosphoribosyl transferase
MGGRQPVDVLTQTALHRAGYATLTVDLLAGTASSDAAAAFDTAVLAPRLVAAARWLAVQPEARGQRLAYLARGLAAGAALWAAADPGARNLVSAVVTLNGRADLAASRLAQVAAPTLLVVDRRDRVVLEANRRASRRLNAASRLVVAPSFRYLRYALRDPRRLEALLAVEWLARSMAPATQRKAAPDHPRPSILSLLDAWPAHGKAAAAATVLALLAALGTPGQPALAAGTLAINWS